ncbi:outer membrane lipoprotein [Roseomonas elaeocarpi]|uniref:17 kDa surface antigen n=1 Tax=Roseomonas elaeocarpi TaxID=907779 RepID=A0ABV6JW17_9PROT
MPVTRTASLRRLRLLLVPLALGGSLVACAPQNTGATYSSAALGVPATVTYGVIKGTRPVVVQNNQTGIGTVAGAGLGGVAGSFIGGHSTRGNILGALGGAVVGGLAGNAIERGAGTGNAIEFVIGQDNGPDITVVQTNEENLQVGDRVFISYGADRARIGRAITAPPGAAPAGYGASPYPAQATQPYAAQPYGAQPGYPAGSYAPR